MEEYRIDLKVRNNLILSKIESLGYRSAHHFCKEAGIKYVTLTKYINMSESIFDFKGSIKPSIQRLCDKLKCIPEEIFSANQMEASLKTNKKTIKVEEAEMLFLMNSSSDQQLLENIVEKDQLQLSIKNTIDTLSPREKDVINMRFGLGEYEGKDHTLDECAEKYNVTRERIRQLEAKALRKMRHPERSKKLRMFTDTDED